MNVGTTNYRTSIKIWLKSKYNFPKISTENIKTPTKINMIKGKLHRSSIHPPTLKIDNSGKAHILNPESNNEKMKTTSSKFEHSPKSKMNHAQPSSGQ